MDQGESTAASVEKVRVDRIVYRVTAEFIDRVPFRRALSEWALDKAVAVMKKAA